MSYPEVLVLVKDWIRDQKNLTSSSFRAQKVHSTGKAVLLRLKDDRDVWIPWTAIVEMEDVRLLK